MALSAAYRTGQRFGVNHLIDVLRGGDTAKIRQFGHDRLPTYGVGGHLDNNQWRSVFRQLVARGYLNVDLDAFGALVLDPSCRALLRGEETIALRRESALKPTRQRSAAGRATESVPDDIDAALWDRLRELRRRLAESHGVPPYVIFHDRTLREMCVVKPQTLAEFAGLTGVGQRKLEKYGEDFLGLLDEHVAGAADQQ
jgi:ATP-dependent DNA helicase RecQ